MVNASNSGPGFPVPPCENLELFKFIFLFLLILLLM